MQIFLSKTTKYKYWLYLYSADASKNIKDKTCERRKKADNYRKESSIYDVIHVNHRPSK